jgi:SAM-dependent methyltransferase
MTTPAAICPICSSRKVHYAFSVEQSRLVECRDCGHMMLYPAPTDADLDRIYDESYSLLDGCGDERLHVSELKRATANHYLDLIGRCLGRHGGRLLEIGSGGGDLLDAAARLGYDVTGVEYSEHACSKARQRLGDRGRIIQGTINDVAENDYYDVCVIADVIEHVRDPREFLDRVYGAIRLGGVVIIATPTRQSWSARLMKDRWMEFKTEHLHYFTQETLHSLLFQKGFDPIGALPGHKWLSFDYVAAHFQKYPVKLVSSCLRHLSSLLPASLRKKPLKVVASGMISVSVKMPRTVKPKLSIVVPVYNEAATLEPVLKMVLEKNLDGVDKEVVIVESNSTDGTRDIVMKYKDSPGVKVVLEDRPRGKGCAVRTGLSHATGDYILIQDGDQEYDIEDYDVLLDPLLTGTAAGRGRSGNSRASLLRECSSISATGFSRPL